MKSLVLALMAIFSFQLGCSGNAGSKDLPPIPVDEVKAFEIGLKGEPAVPEGAFSGDVTLELTTGGKTTVNPAGELEIRFKRTGDQLILNFAIFHAGSTATTTAFYESTIVGNSLVRNGQEIGKIGSFSILLEDEKWTYQFFHGISEDLKTPAVKATAKTAQGNQKATYRALLKKK